MDAGLPGGHPAPEPRQSGSLPPYRVLRSKRRTLAIEVKPGTEVLVRAPLRLPRAEIDSFVRSKRDWILKHWNKPRQARPEFGPREEALLRARARAILPGLIARYGELLDVKPSRLTITGARTRFGSCSAKGGVSFSFRLMAYPLPAVEYVVLHELAHLKHLNHSPAFYRLVSQQMPDYKQRAALLKQPPNFDFPPGGQTCTES